MRESGRIVRLMLEAMKAATRSGITTEQLDEIGGEVMRQHGAVSGPTTVYQFSRRQLHQRQRRNRSRHPIEPPSP